MSEESICKLVDAFYAKVRADPELGPIFERVVVDWQPHLTKMYAFWSSIMLTSGRYKGNPMLKHMAIAGVKSEMFARWLALFDETCAETFDENICNAFRAKADRQEPAVGPFSSPPVTKRKEGEWHDRAPKIHITV